MLKMVLGLLVAFSVGAAARWFDIPAPAPPKLQGALLVVAITLGYVAVDVALSKRERSAQEAPAREGRD